MSKWIPDRKVWAGGLAAVTAWALCQALAMLAGIVVPPDVAMWVVVTAGGAISYLVPPSVADLTRRADETLRRLGAEG
jgi:hypothetical protein